MAASQKVKLSSTRKKERKPKKTRQGKSQNTKLAKTPKNKAKKKYRGQGK
jgi:hypothetical protein